MAPKLRIYLCKLQDELNNNLKEAVKMAKEVKKSCIIHLWYQGRWRYASSFLP